MSAIQATTPDPTMAGLSARAAQMPRSNFSLAAHRFFKQKLAVAGLVVTLGLILIAILAPWIAPTRYDVVNFAAVNQFPSWKYPMGTDTIGHNELSLIIYGIRTSLIVGFSAVGVACLVGLPLGLVAGLKGGAVDFVVGRVVDVMTAFPGILFAIFLMSVVNSGFMSHFFSNQIFKVSFVIGITSWVTLCRLMRAQVFTLREREYITAARSCGATELQIGVKHLLPNAVPPMIVAVTLAIPSAIFAEAGLSFLGVGVNDPLPSLGKMVADSRQYVQLYWHLGLFPAGAIALAVLGFAFVGDGLRDALDPRQN
jgi:ABC-type dipeptide/oligopeptide/nickel transport system permease subunit